MLDGEVVDSLDVATAEASLAGGTLDPRILPKLGAAIVAARHGVAAFIGRTDTAVAEAADRVPPERSARRTNNGSVPWQ